MGKKGAGTSVGVSSVTPVRVIPVGARLLVADNTGAREIQIISVMGYHGKRGSMGRAGVGD